MVVDNAQKSTVLEQRQEGEHTQDPRKINLPAMYVAQTRKPQRIRTWIPAREPSTQTTHRRGGRCEDGEEMRDINLNNIKSHHR